MLGIEVGLQDLGRWMCAGMGFGGVESGWKRVCGKGQVIGAAYVGQL